MNYIDVDGLLDIKDSYNQYQVFYKDKPVLYKDFDFESECDYKHRDNSAYVYDRLFIFHQVCCAKCNKVLYEY